MAEGKNKKSCGGNIGGVTVLTALPAYDNDEFCENDNKEKRRQVKRFRAIKHT
jgi:hypothetical protein